MKHLLSTLILWYLVFYNTYQKKFIVYHAEAWKTEGECEDFRSGPDVSPGLFTWKSKCVEK